MSKLVILLLLLSSKFVFGEFQELPKTESIFKLIEKSSSAYFSNKNHSAIQEIVNAINGSVYDSRVLKLQYNFAKFTNDLNVRNIGKELLDHRGGHHDYAAISETNYIIQYLIHFETIVKRVVTSIYEEKNRKQGHDLSPTAEELVKLHYDSLSESLEKMQLVRAIPNRGDKANKTEEKDMAEIYELFARENILYRCGIGRSPQQTLLALFTTLTNLEIIMMEAFILLTLRKRTTDWRGNDYAAWVTLTNKFVLRYNAYVENFTRTFDKVARDYRSCDPEEIDHWERGTSFFELERYQQLTAFHRSISESRRAQYQDCNDWALQLMYKRDVDNSTCRGPDSDACWMDPVERCEGFPYYCFPSNVKRCINEPGNIRRYSWIDGMQKPGNYTIHDTKCNGKGQHLNEGFGDTCICKCFENNNKVSLDSSLSDIEKNRVITAMRLARENKIVFIQIKQGTLQSDGRIAAESNSWEPSSPPQASNKLFAFYPPGQSINLDDLQGADNEVLTGIGFATVHECIHSGLKLQIRVTKFNFTEGRLTDESRVISDSDEDRTKETFGTDNPMESYRDMSSYPVKSLPTTTTKDTSKRFIEFELSSWTSDAGQTTLPLFDAVPVEGKPASPLSGAGLFHKKASNYGGFLSLRAIGINVAKYFKESVKPLPLVPEGASFKDVITFLKRNSG